MAGRLDEPVSVFPKSVPLEHPQHIGARAYNDGDARQERRTYVERQDLVLGRVGERPFFSWNGVEFGDEDPEDPKAPEASAFGSGQGTRRINSNRASLIGEAQVLARRSVSSSTNFSPRSAASRCGAKAAPQSLVVEPWKRRLRIRQVIRHPCN